LITDQSIDQSAEKKHIVAKAKAAVRFMTAFYSDWLLNPRDALLHGECAANKKGGR